MNLRKKDIIDNHNFVTDTIKEFEMDIDQFLKEDLFQYSYKVRNFQNNLFRFEKSKNKIEMVFNSKTSENDKVFLSIQLEPFIIVCEDTLGSIYYIKENIKDLCEPLEKNLEASKAIIELREYTNNKAKNEMKGIRRAFKTDKLYKSPIKDFFDSNYISQKDKIKKFKEVFRIYKESKRDIEQELKREIDIERKLKEIKDYDSRYLNLEFFKNKINEFKILIENKYSINVNVIYR